jgi:hypothetical protein
MMKRFLRSIVPFVCLLCFIFGDLNVQAADELLGTVVDGSVLTDELEVESTVYPLMRGSYLSSGSGTLKIAGTGKVTIAGNTCAYQTVDEISVTLYLQQLKNGSWVHVTTLGPKKAYNTSYVSNSGTFTVTRGYYYRVTGAHVAIKGDTADALSSFTNALYVP